METTKHIGNNLRKLRILRGMKQETFARELGIAQQNVSKMEKKKHISDEQLEQAAKILQTTTEQIKEFDEKSIFQTNIINENQVNHFNSTKDIIEYFESKIEKKDRELDQLRKELDTYRNGENKFSKPKETAKKTELKSVPIEGKKSVK
jgi:transcriptional regulator with XRE-family HTH domain